MCKIKFMIHKKLSSTHYLTVNILGLNGDSMENGALGCTTFSEKTSIMVVSVDGVDGNGGGSGWNIGASIVYGCDGRDGVDGWPACESNEDVCNKTYVGGGLRYTPTRCTSDCNSLGLDKGNPE
jgi:hypothetical protein